MSGKQLQSGHVLPKCLETVEKEKCFTNQARNKKIISGIIYLVLIIVLSLNLSAETVVLKSDIQDSQPKTIKQSDGTLTGLSIELMKLIEQNSSYKFSLSKDFVPTSRIEKNISDNVCDLHFGFGKTDEREKNYSFSSEPLYELKFLMISNKDDNVTIKTVDDVKKLGQDGVILTIYGTNTVEYLKKDLGLTVDDAAKEIHANFDKLLGKRGRFFVYNNLAVLYEMNIPKYKGKFKTQPLELKKFSHYIMYSKSTPKNVIAGIDDVIKKLKKSGEWQKITNKYLKE